MIREVKVIQCTCDRCGKEFIPRTCPACKSPNWNKQETKQGRPKKLKVTMPESYPPEPEIPDEVTAQLAADAAPIKRQTIREEHPGKCPHHKMHGELCYKCDKKFGLPAIKTGA